MFIDADIGFDGAAVAQLMAADKDIVCGIYPKKKLTGLPLRKLLHKARLLD